MFNDHVSADKVDHLAEALTRQHGGKLLGTMKHAMRGFGVQLTEPQARALTLHPFVEQVEEDAYGFVSASESAPASFAFSTAGRVGTNSSSACPWNTAGYYLCSYGDDGTWWLDRIDNTGLIYSTKAYAYNSMGSGVRVYVVDSGVWAGHTEFDTRVTAGANMTVDPDVNDPVGGSGEPSTEEPPIQADYSPANDPAATPGCYNFTTSEVVYHGTAVASLIGGNTLGVAKNATIVPVKVISCHDDGLSQLAVARGLDWIQADMNAILGTTAPLQGTRAVVNMSLYFHSDLAAGKRPGHTYQDVEEDCEDGSGGFVNCMSAIEHEINQLVGREIPVVTSANNHSNGDCSTSPARMGYGGSHPTTQHTITVGASHYSFDRSEDIKLGTSNYGPCVSMYAPGGAMRVAFKTATGGSTTRNNMSGSSFSSALVSGAVARLLQQYPTLSATQVWTALQNRTAQRNPQPADFDPSSSVTNSRLLYMSHTE